MSLLFQRKFLFLFHTFAGSLAHIMGCKSVLLLCDLQAFANKLLPPSHLLHSNACCRPTQHRIHITPCISVDASVQGLADYRRVALSKKRFQNSRRVTFCVHETLLGSTFFSPQLSSSRRKSSSASPSTTRASGSFQNQT